MTAFKGNINLSGNKILNLGKGANAIPDLDVFLKNLGTQVYGYVYGDPYQGNIAVLPFSNNNTANNNTPLADTGAVKPFQNRFGANFGQNTIGSNFRYNVLGNANSSNKFGINFEYNVTGASFGLNKFEANTKGNVFGDNINTVSKSGFGGPGITGFSNNIVGDNVSDIYIGDNVSYCNIGDNSSNILIGENCYNVKLINCRGVGGRFVVPANSSNVTYINNVLEADPYGVAGKLDKVANLSDVQDKTISRFNLGLTGADGKILPALLAGGIDEILEYPTRADFPAAGDRSKIYVALDQEVDSHFRWSGTVYRSFSSTPGTTDSVTEGANNKYFTEARVLATKLLGFASAAVDAVIDQTTSVLVAFQILDGRTKRTAQAVAGITALIPASASAESKLVSVDDLAELLPNGGARVGSYPFANVASVEVAHGLGRFAFVQIYGTDNNIIIANVNQSADLNKITVDFEGELVSGTIVVI